MIKYLIVKCEELDDQFECDADRTPMMVTDNVKQWFQQTKPKYYFEIYEIQTNRTLKKVKDYDDSWKTFQNFIDKKK